MIDVRIDPGSGFCGGVIRAIDTAEKLLESPDGKAPHAGRLYSLGAIVHNEAELRRLAAKGLGTVEPDSLASLPAGSTVLIRAHGEPPSTYRQIEEAGLRAVDCTCPVVLRLQKQVEEAAGRSRVVIFGKIGHPEVLGLVGRTPGRAVVVENLVQLEKLLADGHIIHPGSPVELFSQTTMNPEDYGLIAARLRELCGENLTVHDSICAQVASRRRKLQDFAERSDVVVFVSGAESSNGKVLCEWCRSVNPRTWQVTGPEDLRPDWFEGAASAGVCGATSTPRWLLEKVAAVIQAQF